jgi:hypothetical protein
MMDKECNGRFGQGKHACLVMHRLSQTKGQANENMHVMALIFFFLLNRPFIKHKRTRNSASSHSKLH